MALFVRVFTVCGVSKATPAVAGTLEIRRFFIASRYLIVLTANANGRIPGRPIAGECGAHKKAPLLGGEGALVD